MRVACVCYPSMYLRLNADWSRQDNFIFVVCLHSAAYSYVTTQFKSRIYRNMFATRAIILISKHIREDSS